MNAWEKLLDSYLIMNHHSFSSNLIVEFMGQYMSGRLSELSLQ